MSKMTGIVAMAIGVVVIAATLITGIALAAGRGSSPGGDSRAVTVGDDTTDEPTTGPADDTAAPKPSASHGDDQGNRGPGSPGATATPCPSASDHDADPTPTAGPGDDDATETDDHDGCRDADNDADDSHTGTDDGATHR